jgi:hypothetical protein
MELYAGFAERSIRRASENLKDHKTDLSFGQSHQQFPQMPWLRAVSCRQSP